MRFNLTEHLARNSVGVSRESRVRTIASKTVWKDLKTVRQGKKMMKEKERERNRQKEGEGKKERERESEYRRARSSTCTSCLVDTTTYDP